jgi:hypothetical protein
VSERAVLVKLRDLPLEERLAAVERILAEDPHMPDDERRRLHAIARDPRDCGGRVAEDD